MISNRWSMISSRLLHCFQRMHSKMFIEQWEVPATNNQLSATNGTAHYV